MIEAFIRGSLNQRLIVMVISAMLIIGGFFAAQKLSLDAFPDVTNIQVQVATVATGKSPEEVERFITVPIEIAMTGLPGLVEMRSLNKDALSLITLVFNDATDVYFARQAGDGALNASARCHAKRHIAHFRACIYWFR